MDLDRYRQDSLASWREVASGWEDRREWLMRNTSPVNDWLVDRLAPQPGQTILEVASGTGDLGERVGDQGKVLSTDFSPEMVDVARRVGEARGVTNVEHRVLDAERMDLEDDSVDGAVCRYGYMLMADPTAALAQTRRVLRDGGPLAFAVWMTPDRNAWAAIPAMTLVQRGHMPPPEPGAPGMFSMGEADRIRELVTSAGFPDPKIEEIAFEFDYPDADDAWDAVNRLAGPLAKIIKDLPQGEQRAVREAMIDAEAGFRNGDGSYTIPAATWGVLVSGD
jgi:ubiquinone/menaquinone biosynthesis C-methylase UbiE